MIYSVVPEELGPEVYERLKAYYADDPNVTVIVDRRRSGRASGGPPTADESEFRGRRRRRAGGEHPPLYAGDGPDAA
ncbi:unannotated protein [freshwater metagenome]|uniref:Unannotated protein n=1 Tax=freshwater metagenome TaxID=449393 RepID=A0A6J7EI83_9ZZZZ|nr:hypothetical protein [Actinomycetota bacterium]